MYALRNKTAGTGNGIVYGGIANGEVFTGHDTFDKDAVEVFFVETDFGNHLSCTPEQLVATFALSHVMSYERWREERDALRAQPNLIEEHSLGTIEAIGTTYRAQIAQDFVVPEDWIEATNKAADGLDVPDLPDPGCHTTGWAAKMISDTWCVGMAGNLDTVHDARLRITGGMLSDDEAKNIASWIVDRYNAALNEPEETMAYDAMPSHIPDWIVEATIRAPKIDITASRQPKAWMYERPGFVPDFSVERQVFPDSLGYTEQALYVGPVPAGKPSGPTEDHTLDEKVKMASLLYQRDKFIVDEGLWDKFVEQLPSTVTLIDGLAPADLAAIWRNGITNTAALFDTVRSSHALSIKRSPAMRKFDDDLDASFQKWFRFSREQSPASYEDAEQMWKLFYNQFTQDRWDALNLRD